MKSSTLAVWMLLVLLVLLLLLLLLVVVQARTIANDNFWADSNANGLFGSGEEVLIKTMQRRL